MKVFLVSTLFCASTAVIAFEYDLGDSDLLNVVCNENENFKVLEVKEGAVSYLRFMNGSIEIDNSFYSDKCGDDTLCGRTYSKGFQSGSFAYDQDTNTLKVKQGNDLGGTSEVTYSPVHCSF